MQGQESICEKNDPEKKPLSGGDHALHDQAEVCVLTHVLLKALLVTRLVDGGPASKSGLIEVGDVLVEVDGIHVYSQPLDVVHSIIKGQEVSISWQKFICNSTAAACPAHAAVRGAGQPLFQSNQYACTCTLLVYVFAI